MADKPEARRGGKNRTPEEWWHGLLTGESREVPLRESRVVLSVLSAHSRCKFCNAPFDGTWAPLMRMMGKGPSRLTQEFCQQCQTLATQHIGGAEVEVALLFADVRGSTTMAERMKPTEFSQLISRYFTTGSHVLLEKHAWIDRLAGDQVVGMFLPYFVGPEHVKVAIDAAQNLLRATGYGTPDGPWIGVGAGVHCGTAFVGTVGSKDGVTDITVLGDVPNVTARLSSAAAAGEILISEDACREADLPAGLEQRSLTLKGKSQPLTVRVLKQPPAAGSS